MPSSYGYPVEARAASAQAGERTAADEGSPQTCWIMHVGLWLKGCLPPAPPTPREAVKVTFVPVRIETSTWWHSGRYGEKML
ncbi:hypothetical protein SAMN04489712_12933 [Thermomonospora echinospora]|uniref:Uncharacterized protein n=1 Tax=Thermomonospora echinospora TaxID=1992 RepID=A0A1H6E1H4_9ACTN|nr:hypothetical protein SAMN04489712_12933 [Thermomonospora echinospora]